ncbi:glycoside hydrolase [Thozetella sp. PMI_491]|nr:glycoside hydrolase [Thozetella sp. PMI_491]
MAHLPGTQAQRPGSHSLHATCAAAGKSRWNTTWLTQLAPPELIMRAVNDWFDHIHSVAPILHRRRFLSRLYDGEAEKNPLFSGLVISVCAAAVATLKRSDYDQLTVDRCLQVVETHQLLAQRSTKAQYSLDWCIAMYNLGTASATLTAIDDVWAYHVGSQSAAGARYLAYYCLEQLPLVEKEMLKRLFWLLVAWACSCDLFGRLSIGLLTHQEKLAQLRPLVLTDRELDTESYCSPHSVSPWSGDDTSYVPGLNHLSDLFMIWHEAQTTPSIQPNEALQRYTERVQATIDGLPPSIRWRGGLSRPAAVTSLHDVQVVNLYISALHIRSNLLQKFGTQSAVDHVAAEHQRIIDDLLEILYHMPQAVFDANGSSVVPKVRDIGAAYLEQLSLQHVPAGDGAREKIERLLWKLDTLDFRPAVAFLRAPELPPTALPMNPITTTIPHLRRTNGSTHLIVNGKPFLMLAGELHNSSLSSARFMSEVWPAMKAQNINTLVGSVSWEMIEPVEGQFDFAELDAVLDGAREHDMRLVILWFGTYKNGISTYAPGWVKKDTKRFPRCHVLEAGGVKRTVEMVSPLSEEGCKADSRAFTALMRHLKEVDGLHNTVLMVQVENETGLLGDSRDRSRVAEKAFAEPVPEDLLKHLNNTTTHQKFSARYGTIPEQGSHSWESVFGPGVRANEAFMAYHISRYVGRVAAAGRQEYPIPLYTNTWLNFDDPSALDLTGTPIVVGGGAEAGVYPSGGPCPHVMDIWKFNAPALDFLAPDLYFHEYEGVCIDYTANENPLFIPEQRRDANGARRVWLAYATYGALGTSPFGIDTGAEEVGREYKLLAQTKDYLLSAAPADRMGFFFDEEVNGRGKEKWVRVFGDLEVTVERAFVFGKPGPGGGMILHLGDAKFLLVGRGFHARFKSVRKEATFTGILTAEEKEVGEDGKLRTLRVLNGDETRSGEFIIMPNDDPDYGRFPIAVTIPARTCIAEVEAYWVAEDAEDQ